MPLIHKFVEKCVVHVIINVSSFLVLRVLIEHILFEINGPVYGFIVRVSQALQCAPAQSQHRVRCPLIFGHSYRKDALF